LGPTLVSCHCKKQNSVGLFTAKGEYIAAEAYRAQLLWMYNNSKILASNIELCYSDVTT